MPRLVRITEVMTGNGKINPLAIFAMWWILSAPDEYIALASRYRLTGVAFWDSAKNSESMIKSRFGEPTEIEIIPYLFLVAHATELFLKAALARRGYSERYLTSKPVRHNLNKLLELLQNNGVSPSSSTVELIDGLSEDHEKFVLRYGQAFFKKSNNPASMNDLNDMLLELLQFTGNRNRL